MKNQQEVMEALLAGKTLIFENKEVWLQNGTLEGDGCYMAETLLKNYKDFKIKEEKRLIPSFYVPKNENIFPVLGERFYISFPKYVISKILTEQSGRETLNFGFSVVSLMDLGLISLKEERAKEISDILYTILTGEKPGKK